MTPIRYCSVPGCDREYRAGVKGAGRGMCPGHYSRWRRGRAVLGQLRPRTNRAQRLQEAAIRFADAEGEAEYRLALAHLYDTAREYAKHEQRVAALESLTNAMAALGSREAP